jgi:hypothetical protein
MSPYKSHMSVSSASLVIVIKSKNKYGFHVATIKLFHICICFRRLQDSALSGASITVIMEVCLPTLFVLLKLRDDFISLKKIRRLVLN